MADDNLDNQRSINRLVQERLTLLEKERNTLLGEVDIYKKLLGTNLDLSQVRNRYHSDEKDILQTIRTNTNILKDQSKQITFQVAEKSRIQQISNRILAISEDSYSMLMDELGTVNSIGDIEKKREVLAKKIIELESFRGTILFEDKELQASFNEELEASIKGAADLEAQLTDTQNVAEKIQSNVTWFDALKETSNKIGLGKFTNAFEEAAKAARETAAANEISKKVANELVTAKEEEAKAISAAQTAEEELQKLRKDNKQAMLDENKQRNDIKKSLKEKEDILSKINNLSQEELETGEGLTAERLKQLGLADKVKGTQGSAAKEVIKALKAEAEADKKKGEISLNNLEFSKKERNEKLKGIKDTLDQANQEKTLTSNRVKGLKGQQQQLAKMTGKAGMKGITAGAKALGPLLKKALGPLSIILLIKDAIDFVKEAIFAASKRTADFQKSLGLGRDRAKELSNELRKTAAGARDFADTVNEGDDNMGRIAGRISRVQVSIKSLNQSFSELNQNLGTSLDVFSDLGDEGRQLLVTTSLFRDNLGLSSQAISELQKEQIRTGKNQEDIVKEVYGEITARNLLNDTAIDAQLVLEDVFKLSEKTKAMFGFQTVELAKAVYEARKLGFNLDELDNTANSLLDFESSIAKELEAELILGKDLNLEKARQFALNNDLVGVANELRKQNVDIVELQQENRIAAEAYAAAVGTPLDTLIKQEKALREIEGVERRLLKHKIEGFKIDGKTIDAQRLMNMSVTEYDKLIKDGKVSVADLKNILGETVYQNKLAEDAQTKFNKALDMAKEQFAYFVSSGVLEDLVNTLADFAAGFSESAMFEFFAGDEAERETRRIERELKIKANNLQAENERLAGEVGDLENKKNLTKEDQDRLKNLETQIDSNKETLKTTNENQGKINDIAESSNSSIVGRETAAGVASGAMIGAGIGTIVPVIGTAIGAAVGGIIGGIGGYFSGTSIDEKRDAEALETLNQAKNEDGSINFTKIKIDDAIIRPNEKQIIVPNKQDVITTFKPGGVIDKTLSTDTSLDTVVNKPIILEPTTVIDNSELIKEISKLREDLAKTNSRPVQVESTINLDGNKVGTALGMASYRTQ